MPRSALESETLSTSPLSSDFAQDQTCLQERASLSASHKFRDFREDLLLIHVVSYDNYPDFRHEINKVLESNVWVMDIV